MMWLAWRQLRAQAYFVAGFLIVVAVALALTGPHLAHLYDTTVATCGAHGDCGSVQATFLGRDEILQQIDISWSSPRHC
jgi:hypothetical protein